MPMGMVDGDIKIVLHDTYPGLSIVEQTVLNFSVMKQKIFAFPAPSKYYYLYIFLKQLAGATPTQEIKSIDNYYIRQYKMKLV